MTGRQVRALLNRLDITRRDFARLLDVDEDTVGRWLRKGARGPASLLMQKMVDGTVSIADVRQAQRRPQKG